MDYSKLDELMKIKKKGDKAKEIKNEYSKEIIYLLNDEGLSDNAVKYIYDGFSFLGAVPFFEFLKTVPSEKVDLIYFQLKSSRSFVTHKEVTLKLFLHLFSLFLNEKTDCINIIADVICITPKLIKNKDGSIRNDLEKVLEKYLLSVLDNKVDLPEITTLNLKKASLISFKKMLYTGFENYRPSKQSITNNMAKLHKWLESIEENKEVEKDEKTVSMKPDICKVKKEVLSIDNSEDKQKKSVSNFPEWKCGLQAIEAFFIKLENKINSQNEDLINLNLENGKLQKQLSLKEKDLTILHTENEDLKKNINQNWVKIRELQKSLENLESKLLQSKQELNSRIELSEMMERDHKKQQQAFMNRLSNEFKVEYMDFLNAENEKMTIDLGENMRLQLLNVFDILKNYGMAFMQ